jgi:hypothetical protein
LQLQYAEFQKDGVEEATKDNLDAINNVKMAENALTNFYINENKRNCKQGKSLLNLCRTCL